MNVGERDEIIFKCVLVYLRDNKESLFSEQIKSVGFGCREYRSFPANIEIRKLNSLSDDDLSCFALKLGIEKAATGAKADVFINGRGVSLKSLRAAPAALVNHTSRPGFEFACNNTGISIDILDSIIEDYWKLRIKGVITEDTKIADLNCPFKPYKEYLKPILEYFLFSGTGSKLSSYPADYIIEFDSPFDFNSFRKLTKKDAVESVWPKLIFSLRAKKGMPSDYNLKTYVGPNASSIAKWVRFHSGDYRGALHIRTSR